MKQIIYIIICVAAFSACTKEIDFEFRDEAPLVVIEGKVPILLIQADTVGMLIAASLVSSPVMPKNVSIDVSAPDGVFALISCFFFLLKSPILNTSHL